MGEREGGIVIHKTGIWVEQDGHCISLKDSFKKRKQKITADRKGDQNLTASGPVKGDPPISVAK